MQTDETPILLTPAVFYMPTIRRIWRHTSWIQRLFLLVLIGNMALILWGIHVVPATVATPDGIARILADLGLQMVLGVLALFGPLSFQRSRSSIGISLLFGFLFAIAYDGILLLDYLGVYLDVNVYLFFLGAASLAGLIAGYQTRRFSQGVVAAIWALVIGTAIWSTGLLPMHYAFWGSHQAYVFWQNDGAIDDFQHSGMTDLNVFLMQDVEGSLFFHPLLSAVTGAICGVVASSVAQGVLLVRKKRSAPAAS
jgi:hypothetical protein